MRSVVQQVPPPYPAIFRIQLAPGCRAEATCQMAHQTDRPAWCTPIVQIAPAARAGLALKIDHHLIARQGCRQLAEVSLTSNLPGAVGLAVFRFGVSPGIARGRTGTHRLLKILDDQLHLLGIQLLGTLAKPVPLKALDHDVQLVDLGAQSGILKLSIGHQLAQRGGIFGQVFKVDGHARFWQNRWRCVNKS